MSDSRKQPDAGRRGPLLIEPLLVEVVRGDMVESRHAVAFAAVDASGRRVASGGDVEAPV
jgi:L-asparaginase II